MCVNVSWASQRRTQECKAHTTLALTEIRSARFSPSFRTWGGRYHAQLPQYYNKRKHLPVHNLVGYLSNQYNWNSTHRALTDWVTSEGKESRERYTCGLK